MQRGAGDRTRLVLGVLLTVTALGWAAPVQGQTTLRDILVDGQLRGFYEHVPPSYDGATPVPLVVMLHGQGGSGLLFELLTAFSLKADQAGFIVVYPNALGNPRAWNTPWSPGSGYDPQIDIDFLARLLEDLQARYNIDPNYIFVGGQSSGACMSYLIAATLSDQIAAVGDVGGSIGSNIAFHHYEAPPPDFPVSAVIFHGMQDSYVPYWGGKGTEFTNIHWSSVLHTTYFWVDADGCDPVPIHEVSDDGNILRDTFTGGVNGTEVMLYSIVNGQHVWPPLSTLDVASAMWDFFMNHPRQR